MSIFENPHNTLATCNWLPLNHYTFYIANFFLVTLYIGDFINFPTPYNYMVFLRIVLSGSALFFSCWGFWILCAFDTGMWNFLFLLYNLAQLCYVVYKRHCPNLVKPRFEALYRMCYKKSGLPVDTYNTLIQGARVVTIDEREIRDAKHFSHQLAQIISGKLVLYLVNGKKVRLRDGDFINNNNWNFSGTAQQRLLVYVQKYEVVSDTKLLYWDYDTLTSIFSSSPSSQHLFSNRLLTATNQLLLKLVNMGPGLGKGPGYPGDGSVITSVEEDNMHNMDNMDNMHNIALQLDTPPLSECREEESSELLNCRYTGEREEEEEGTCNGVVFEYAPLIEAESNV